MPITEFLQKPLPALRLAARTVTVRDWSEVGEAVGAAFGHVAGIIGDTPGTLHAPVASYSWTPDGLRIVVGYVYEGEARGGVEIAELPEESHALCTAHYGPVSGIGESWQALHAELEARGLRPGGPSRELYLRAGSEDQHDWVTELQQPVRPAD
ncbi:GyrI-like domain-containing protein [Nesterenkonia sp. CL21]|uniref:GyrI-like domain-containing protein n=1 Tax=Nesterenkonia sp. CL21 TaxID=3064894 RepID=UPI002878B2C5|nr:GyrI-like domain-containing protein [Nesterenkonia sp. CL21]MDS2172303.1 GyrI-like domain-containing protein [Nesterenkonia sp. CL21]